MQDQKNTDPKEKTQHIGMHPTLHLAPGQLCQGGREVDAEGDDGEVRQRRRHHRQQDDQVWHRPLGQLLVEVHGREGPMVFAIVDVLNRRKKENSDKLKKNKICMKI